MAYREAKTPTDRGKVMSHIEIHPKMGGGVNVFHHYHDSGLMHHGPELMGDFGPDEKEDFHRHIAKHTDGHFHQVDKAAQTDEPADLEREAEEA